jgi:hypothetical protein
VLIEGAVAVTGTAGPAVVKVIPHPKFVDQFIILTKSPWIHVIGSNAQVRLS